VKKFRGASISKHYRIYAVTDKDFDELCDFIKEVEFDRLGVFTYSVEDNTHAYTLDDPIPQEVKEDRKNTLMEIQKDISLKKNEALVGKTMKVVIDDIEGEYYIARSERDAPEVDGEVIIPAENRLLNVGEFYNIEISDCNEYDLFAKLNSMWGK